MGNTTEERVLDNHDVDTTDNLRLQEVLRGYRVITIPPKHPMRKQLNKETLRIYDRSIMFIATIGDKAYKDKRDALLKDGASMTRDEVMHDLVKRKVWGPEKEDMIESIRKSIEIKSEDRDAAISRRKNCKENSKQYKELDDEVTKLMIEINDLLDDLYQLVNMQTLFFRDTIELNSQVEQRLGWLAGAVCYDEGDEPYDPDKRVWKSVSELHDSRFMRSSDLAWLMAEADSFWRVSEQETESFFDELPADQI